MNRTTVKGLLIVLSLSLVLVSMFPTTASAALTTAWTPSVKTVSVVTPSKSFFSIIGAVAKFEGTLQAYSVSEDPNLEEQLFLASDEISASLKSLNVELKEIFSSLDEDQQLAIIEVYSSLGSYLVELAEEANQVFQEEGRSTVTFEVQKIGEIAKNLPNQLWVGSAVTP
jgi:hypothetical protein